MIIFFIREGGIMRATELLKEEHKGIKLMMDILDEYQQTVKKD